MKRTFVLSCVAGLLSTAASAQLQTQTFPLEVVDYQQDAQRVRLAPRLDQIQGLLGAQELRLRDVFLPDGSMVELDLTRVSVARRKFSFIVDGAPRPDLLQNLDLTLWKGSVAGEENSEVMLSFSSSGTRGWIKRGEDLVHLMPQASADGSWVGGEVLVATDQDLVDSGNTFEQYCANELLPPEVSSDRSGQQSGIGAQDKGSSLSLGANCSLREAKIAIEGDYQLYQVFNDLNALTTYVTTLLSFVSDRYETQANCVLTFPYVQFYTNSNDPWSAQDSAGNDCIDVLLEFQAAWVGNIPGGADIGHLLSGANLGCGVAWLDVLCDDELNFSVSGNLSGSVNFPVQQQPSNWDFIVIAHELGHNFASPHTHDYCPPLDECPEQQYWGQCQTQEVCSNAGTIMSYCHLCPGGTGNITTFFHPTVSGVMTNAVNACLPNYSPIFGDVVDIMAPNVTVPVTATIGGTPVGNVELFYRFDSGDAYSSIAMVSQGGGVYAADIPAPSCDDTPEYYYAYDDAACGPSAFPAGAPATALSAIVGESVITAADDFETDQGWSAQNLGASSGDWQRGVPVNDGGWDYDPTSDGDGSGQAFLTQNENGNTDVDGGAVSLTSPSYDMSAGGLDLSYQYFLRLTDEDGTDRLLVEASSNGLAGPFVELTRHDTDGGLAWRDHTVTAGDFAAAGVAQTADMVFRFTANDGDTQSIVEAGLDGLEIGTFGCGSGVGTGDPGCVPNANSTGVPSEFVADGSLVIADNNLDFSVTNLPLNKFGYFLMSASNTSVPVSDGILCLGQPQIRFNAFVLNSGGLGSVNFSPDLTSLPQSTVFNPGETWYFQLWHRDQNPGNTSNFSNNLAFTWL